MTKTGYKILSGCLCAALICTITGASVHAENGALHAPQRRIPTRGPMLQSGAGYAAGSERPERLQSPWPRRPA